MAITGELAKEHYRSGEKKHSFYEQSKHEGVYLRQDTTGYHNGNQFHRDKKTNKMVQEK